MSQIVTSPHHFYFKLWKTQFLHDGSEVFVSDSEEGTTWFSLPVVEPSMISPVIEVFLKDN